LQKSIQKNEIFVIFFQTFYVIVTKRIMDIINNTDTLSLFQNENKILYYFTHMGKNDSWPP